MTRPNPIAIIALCIVAITVLAFTINDQLTSRNNSIAGNSTAASKNISIETLVAKNPPHGKPGHRHDLPDGAVLPTAIPSQTFNTNSSLNSIVSSPTAEINGGNTAINPPHGQSGHVCGIPVGAPLDSLTLAKAANDAAAAKPANDLNPEHGQPGHRCDVAVGASLSSAPAKTTTTPSSSTTTTTTNKTTVANGLNPAHGQPGHRCDVAVGAPLNSEAKKQTTPPANTSLNSSLFPSYNFPNKDSIANTAPVVTSQFEYDSTGAALNPPHGKSGHNCNIAVGKPLPK
jgi:hypothetical protein